MTDSPPGDLRSRRHTQLTVAEVRAIRRRTESHAVIAAEYGVTVARVRHLRTWQSWAWLDPELAPPRKKRVKARYNGHGGVWCAHCRRYLPASRFRPHPSRPGKFWTYCRTCTMVRDNKRRRPERVPGTPEYAAKLARANERKRRRRAVAQAERREFVRGSIDLLRRRGFTKAEICRLAGVTFHNLLRWERDEVNVQEAVANRIGVVLMETAYLKAGPEPAYRRRHPHPDLPLLLARIGPHLERYPVRSRWRNQDDRRAA